VILLIWVPIVIWALTKVSYSANHLEDRSSKVTTEKNQTELVIIPSNIIRKKVFVDLGARGGDSATLFLEKYPNASQFELHFFECDPAYSLHLTAFTSKQPNSYFHEEAAWIADTNMTFGIAGSGSSLLETALNDKQNKFVVVKAIDLAAWLKKNFIESDFVLMKMDIEGAEFKIIPKLIDTEAYKLIDTLLLECHYYELTHLFPNILQKDCEQLVLDLREIGWDVIDWALRSDWSAKHGGFHDPFV